MKRSILREIVQYSLTIKHHEVRYKHFAFIIQDNKIVEVGLNRTASPLVTRGFPAHGKLHAETEAYRKAKGMLYGGESFDCVNVRVKNGAMKLSAPCNCCLAFLRNVGCHHIWFSTDAQEFARL